MWIDGWRDERGRTDGRMDGWIRRGWRDSETEMLKR